MDGSPLVKKLGLKEGIRAKFINSPNKYFDWLGEPFPEFEIVEDNLDFIHIFTNSDGVLNTFLAEVENTLKPNGIL